MKLYYAPVSTYSQKALIALYEKGLAFEPEIVELTSADARAAYEQVYPLGKVPFLMADDGWAVPESTIIIEFLDDRFPEEVHRQAAADGLEIARQAIRSGDYALVVLDEILYAIQEGLLSLADVVALLGERKPEVSVILTGRNAPQELIELADTVTEMREIKHPFQKGILAMKGIDY